MDRTETLPSPDIAVLDQRSDLRSSAHPVVRIRPSGKWSALNLRDIWAYRELIYFLTLRDVKLRYKQTLLGVTWIVLQPVLTMLVFTLLFGKLVGIPSDGIPYALFAYAGLLPWLFFSKAVTQGGNSLVGSANLITKVYFPRMVIPVAAVVACLVDFAVAFVILVGLMAYYKTAVTVNILMLPGLVLLTTMFALGVGMWLSALNVRYRDVGAVLPFLIQLWMFATPIIYPLSLAPPKWRSLVMLNPLTGIIEGYRAALFGSAFDWSALGLAAVFTMALLVYAAFAFRRMEKTFADIV